MPNLSQLVFSSLLRENDNTQNAELRNTLTELYGNEPHSYENLADDFDICKTQLLVLLEYIEQLNPNTLHLFAIYKERVTELTKESAQPDIRITFKAAKEALEKSLLSIISKHQQIDKTALNNLTAGLCYAGAYSNIEQALGYFNGTNSLSAMIHYAKRTIILDLAAAYLNEHDMIEHVGNEVHMANSLFNFVADKYGLPVQEDLFAPAYGLHVLEAFEIYVNLHMTVPNLIQQVMRSLPSLQETITKMDEFQTLGDLFQLLGYKNPGWNEYTQLYDDEDVDDVPTYIRKQQWELLLSGVVTRSMEKAGYLTNSHIVIDNKAIIDSGDYIFGASNDTIEFLSQEDLLLLVNTPDANIEKWRFMRQMTPETIMKTYLTENQSEEIKHFCFRVIIEHIEIPPLVLNQLYFAIRDSGEADKLHDLAHYVFSTRQNLPADELKHLAGSLSAQEIYHYLFLALTQDIPSHVNALLSYEPSPLSYMQIIHLACQNNALNVVRLLGKLGLNLNTMDNSGYTPACTAVLMQNRELLAALSESRADLNRPAAQSSNDFVHQGRAPVHIAAALSDIQMLETLHELGVALDSIDKNGDSAACIAINNNDIVVLEKLHELGVDLNKKCKIEAFYFSMYARPHSLSPLELTIKTGNIDMLRVLQILDVDLNSLDGADDTPVCLAIHLNKLHVINTLHELGADISKRDKNGFSPTDHAARNGNTPALKLLKQLGADINAQGPSGATAAFVAAEHGRADAIRTLNTLKADFNRANAAQQTPIFIAAKNGHTKVLKWLYKYKADINKADNQNHTPVYIAALHSQLEAFNDLVSYGADLNIVHQNISDLICLNSKNKDKKMLYRLLEMNVNLESITDAVWLQILNNLNAIEIEDLLSILIRNNNVSIFRKLLEIPFTGKNHILTGLVYYAAQHAQSESFIQLIHESGTNVNSCNIDGESTAYLAAKAGNILVMKQLIDLNVDLECETTEYETPAFVAARMGHESIVQLLLQQNKADNPITISINTLKSMVRKMDAQIIARAVQKIAEQGDGYSATLTPKDMAWIMGHEHIVTLIDSYQPAPLPAQNKFGFFTHQEVFSPPSRNTSVNEDENTFPNASPSKINPKKRPNLEELFSPVETKKPYEPSGPDIEYQHSPSA